MQVITKDMAYTPTSTPPPYDERVICQRPDKTTSIASRKTNINYFEVVDQWMLDSGVRLPFSAFDYWDQLPNPYDIMYPCPWLSTPVFMSTGDNSYGCDMNGYIEIIKLKYKYSTSPEGYEEVGMSFIDEEGFECLMFEYPWWTYLPYGV